MSTAPQVDFSIIVGLVSTEDSDRILETLEALRGQRGSPSYEVVIGDRRQAEVSRMIAECYPEVQLIACEAGTTLPQLRTAALDAATGRYIVVTEDHCVPSDNWLQSMQNALASAPPDVVAVGGCVENGVTGRALDWATFFCEYSNALAPVPEGETDTLPGMNVVYRYDALANVDRQRLEQGFWETTVHGHLLETGKRFQSSNDIVLYHCKKFSFRLFMRQRFVYSRYFAGLRFARHEVAKRMVATVFSVALPGLLLLRIVRNVRSKNRLQWELLKALPALSVFVVVWGFGEMVGYVAGQGGALAEIE
ncbi:MAG: glycosyltransferase [Alphaproteobacteria bacterium]